MNTATLDTTSGRTAIARQKPSLPLRWLINHNYIKFMFRQSILDYGCGRGRDVDYLGSIGAHAVGFDPNQTDFNVLNDTAHYDVVLCTYVLNTVSPEVQREITWELTRIASESINPTDIYVTVRRDIPKEGTRTQRWVELSGVWRSIRRTSGYEIYHLNIR